METDLIKRGRGRPRNIIENILNQQRVNEQHVEENKENKIETIVNDNDSHYGKVKCKDDVWRDCIFE